MKKIVLLAILVLMLIPDSYSQFGNFTFGLKASPNISWIRPETRGYEGEGTKLGFSYGIIADYRIGDFYVISSGLHISSFGGSLSYEHRDLVPIQGGVPIETDGILTRDYRLRYLEIPITLKMHTDEIGYITYYGRFGFSPGVNLRARADDRFRVPGIEESFVNDDVDINSEISFFRLALVVGLGLEYSLGGRTAMVGGLTFNNGFTNVLSGRNRVSDRAHSAVSNYLELTIGVMF